jgi:hypothetical protein
VANAFGIAALGVGLMAYLPLAIVCAAAALLFALLALLRPSPRPAPRPAPQPRPPVPPQSVHEPARPAPAPATKVARRPPANKILLVLALVTIGLFGYQVLAKRRPW